MAAVAFRDLVDRARGAYSYAAIAEDFGISRAHLWNLMAGKYGTRYETAERIAESLRYVYGIRCTTADVFESVFESRRRFLGE